MSAPRYFRVKNYEKHQHYKERRPPWIKLYATVLEDYAFACLQDASKAHAMLIWLLASRHENRLPFDPAWVGKAIQATDPVDLEGLVSAGFLTFCEDASTPLADSAERARPREQRTENREQPKSTPVVPTTKTRPRAPESSPDVDAVLAHFASRHPRRRPTPSEAKLVTRVLASGWSVQDCVDAIDGNADDDWHREKRKHELGYVLRDGKRDGFRERGEAVRTAPACAMPDAVGGWFSPELDRLTDPTRKVA